MLHLLKGARADPYVIRACKAFRCPHCTETQSEGQVVKFKMPSTYAFDCDVMLDVFFLRDIGGDLYGYLSIVDAGTGFHAAPMIREGKGIPGSAKCLHKFQQYWTHWAGHPKFITTDPGLHNRGVFARGISANGTYQRSSGVEAHQHLGKAEHHGGILKTIAKKLIKEFDVSGKAQMKQMMTIAV